MVLTGLVVLQLAVSWRAEAQINSYWDLYHFWIQAFDSCVRVLSPTLNKALLLKAPIDECFYGVGNPLNQYLATSCPNGRWKRNGGQVWALAKWGDKVWVGTRENAICTTMGFSGVMEPIRTDYAVCEFGQSAFVPPLPDYLGDWRPPSIYVYDVQTGQSRRVAFLTPGSLGGIPLIQGLRGAGAVNGIVFMAGLAGTDSQNASLVLFAYNSDTEEFLGWRALNGPDGTRYKNTRKWLTFKGHLYGSAWVEGGGRIIRWLGDAEAIKKGDVRTLWNFEEVGYLDQAPANMTVYDGKRLAVGTRPKDTNRVLRGGQIWLSPEFQDHLTAQDAFQWKVVWSAAAYEPDTVTAAATAVGDLAFFDGYLWWGTEMQVEQAWGIHKEVYGRLLPGYPSTDQDIAALLGTWRPTSVFRGRHMESENYQVDLLYGFSLLPRFEVNQETGQGRWTLAPNRMGAKPLYGPGGFCNWYQVQTYSMAVFGNRLYVGTSEYSQRMASGFLSLPDFPKPTPSPELWGADLWRFDSAEAGAVAESLGGIGNYLNAAVRNLLADDALYVGTGNTSNLATDPRDDVPEGGWELIRLWE
uniref:Uncharacterized protein n=1 Tax=Desulfacinum infernum TaxID=35837 RepID=A0A832A4P1_9BACT